MSCINKTQDISNLNSGIDYQTLFDKNIDYKDLIVFSFILSVLSFIMILRKGIK